MFKISYRLIARWEDTKGVRHNKDRDVRRAEPTSFAKQYNVPGATINPYTNLTGKDVQSKWNEVKTLVPQRDQTLQDELKKQENNEALRRQFAEKSNQVGPWIERQMDAVAAIGMGMQGSLEEQLSRLREYEEAVYQFKPHLEELERINQQIQVR